MPLTRLSLEERIRLVRYFSLYEKSSHIQKAWRKEMGTDPPSRKTIAALNKKFDETGSVADLNRSGRPKTTRTEEKVALVQAAIKQDPTKSIRHLSNELGVNKAAIHRIKQDSDNHKCTMRQENRKLRDKIVELQRRIDILEGRVPQKRTSEVMQAGPPKKKPKKLAAKQEQKNIEISMPDQEIVTTIPTSSFHPGIHLVSINDAKTVISVVDASNMHLHTHEMVDAESGEVHHITLEETEIEGEHQEFEVVHQHEEEAEEPEHELEEDEDSQLLDHTEEEAEIHHTEDYEEDHSEHEAEILVIQGTHGGLTKFEPEEVEIQGEGEDEESDMQLCYVTATSTTSDDT